MTTRPHAPLPAERVPFPVEPQYRVRPDLRKLATGARRFMLDEAWPRYLARKLELLSSYPGQCRVIGGDEGRIIDGLWRVAGLLAEEQPERVRVDARAVELTSIGIALTRGGEMLQIAESLDSVIPDRVYRHLEPLSPAARLADALALAVQEDLVLVAGPPARDSASLLHVCFPSHWNPGERAGASFAQLHAPVPHNERLLAGSRNMISAMLTKGPFMRFVWSLTRTPELDQNPARVHSGTESEQPGNHTGNFIDRLYFRSERQTTSPFGDFALFTIRIYVAPLRRMLDPRRAALLASAIRSMDEDLLRYKSLTEIQEPLLSELDALSSDNCLAPDCPSSSHDS